ncbi:MAG: hypothetical protein ABI969_10790 [bacterium]
MHVPNRAESLVTNETPPTRSFLDSDGSQWLVYEQQFADYDRRRGMSLIFSSDAAVRRVRDYPANWFDLTDEQLVVLSWKA